MTLTEAIYNWMQEDEFLSAHFLVRHHDQPHTFLGTINMACFHDKAGHSYEQFSAWILNNHIESDLGDFVSADDQWITIRAGDPEFFPKLEKFLHAVHAYYGKYCRPKWTHLKKSK